MRKNNEFNKDWLEMFFAPLCFGGFLIMTIYVIICNYLSVDIDRGGIIIIPIWISYWIIYYLLFKFFLKNK